MKKRVCFFCNTPFQIMTALSIQIQERYEADICIDPHFDRGEHYKIKLEELHLFNNVRMVEKNDLINTKIRAEGNSFKRKIRLLLLYASGYSKKFLSCEEYDCLFTTTNAFLFSLCSSFLQRKNKETKVIYYDDGEGSYDDFVKIYKAYHDELMSIFLYSPDLFKLCYPSMNVQTRQISRWKENAEIRSAIEYVFEQTDKAKIREKYIIIDTIKSEAISQKDADVLDELYHELAEIKGKDNVIIKKHPRDTTRDELIHNYPYTSIPFEYIALESEIENKVIISLSSTATIMSKIILDQEPTVILLYRLFKMGIGEDDTREIMYQNCRSMYKDKDKFIIPESKEELIAVFKNV